MKKWMKKKTLTAVTGVAVLGAATAALGNASSLETIFNPDKFEKYENRHHTEDYDYVAGNDGDAELADKSQDGEDATDESENQQMLQVTEQERVQDEQKSMEEDDSADLGIADQSADNTSQEENKNGIEFKQTTAKDNTDPTATVPQNGTSGNSTGNGQSGNSSSGSDNSGKNKGKKDSTTTDSSKNNTSSNSGNSNNTNGNNGNTGDNSNNGNNTNSGNNGKTDTDNGNNNNNTSPTSTPTPTPKPESWEDKQLKPKDPTVTSDGTLTALEVNLRKEMYAVGDTFSAEDAEVTAIFSNTDGSTFKKTLNYGGDGYEVSLYTKNKGTYTAVFKYGGLSVRLTYQVMSNYVTLNYMSWYDNKYYSSIFPGEGLKEISKTDFAEIDKLREFPYTFPSTGNVIDLTDIHRRMIAYLEDERIENIFKNSIGGNYNTTVFLNEENGYLTNMLQGFRFILSYNVYDDRSYVYYPASGWDAATRNVINIVGDVPEGYWIRRVTENEDSLKDYIGDQVLEKYTGTDSSMNVPMGTTKVDLKEKAEQVTSMAIPQSVSEINVKSLAENLPNLENYIYAEGETDTVYGSFKIADGLLLSNDGKTLLSVPSGKKSVTIPATVSRLAEGCFRGLSADAVITFESETPPEIEGETGYQGTILTQDSDYDVVCKAYMFRFADENKTIRFATVNDTTVRYIYLEDGPILVQNGDASILMGIPQDVRGKYQVSEAINTIGAGAFAGCKRVTDIELPEAVTKLEEGSLALPDTIASVSLLDSDTEISEKIFGDPASGAEVPDITVWVNPEDYEKYLENWTAVLDPVYGEGTAAGLLKAATNSYIYEDGAKYEQVETAEGTAYRLLRMYAENKRTFQVKEGTIEIAVHAFGQNNHLEILSIPSSVKTIGAHTFANCSALETVTCADKERFTDTEIPEETEILVEGTDFAFFTLENGVLYGIDASGMQILINVGTDYQGELPVRENTTVLYKEALENCTGITDISFAEDSLTEIGDGCFRGCTQFKELDFSGHSQLSGIGAGAFEDCTGLDKVSLPAAVTELGGAVFKNCTSLECLEASGIQTIGNEAFYNCSSLADASFLDGVNTLGDEAFYGCRTFTEIELPETLSQMGESCFENCVALKKIAINGSLTGISRYCFYGCRDLKEITFGDVMTRSSSIRVIGVEAFGQCYSLETLDLEGLTSLTQMGTGVFESCISLTKVKLPLNLVKIPNQCFVGCKELSILQSSADTVIEPDSKIFGDTLPTFIHVWVKEDMVDAYKAGWKPVLDADYGEGTAENIIEMMNDKIEIVKGVVFEVTEKGRILREASPDAIANGYTVPEDTIEIAADAFAGCTNLKELLLPKGSSIALDDRCFKGCTGLESVYMYGAVPQWGEEVFMDCTGLKKVYIGVGDGAAIPRIGTRAFKNCTGLAGETPVELRSATAVWGEECFAGCTTLKSIGLANVSRDALTVIEDCAMRGCTSLRVLLTSKFVGLRTIGNYAFENCDTLNAPAIPAGVTSIGEGCFMNCDNVTTVSFYGALDEYPKDCFKNCPKLTRTGGTAAAFNGLKRIGEGAYEGCVSLVSSTSWNLGRYANLESIGDRAFYGDVNLTDSTLGEAFISIGSNSFGGCTGIHTLTINAIQTPTFGAMDLTTMAEDFTIRVPDSQDTEDSVYKDYLKVLSGVIGEEKALSILDSISDGAKDRYAEELNKESQEPEEAKEAENTPEETEQTENPGTDGETPANGEENKETSPTGTAEAATTPEPTEVPKVTVTPEPAITPTPEVTPTETPDSQTASEAQSQQTDNKENKAESTTTEGKTE